MAYFYCILGGFLLGFGIAYGFRGWIERSKQKAKKVID